MRTFAAVAGERLDGEILARVVDDQETAAGLQQAGDVAGVARAHQRKRPQALGTRHLFAVEPDANLVGLVVCVRIRDRRD